MVPHLTNLVLVVRGARFSTGIYMLLQSSWLSFHCFFVSRFPIYGQQYVMFKFVQVYRSVANCGGLICCVKSVKVLRCQSMLQCCICLLALYVDILNWMYQNSHLASQNYEAFASM